MADQIPAALTPTEDLTPDQMPAQLGSTPIASTTGQISGDSLPLYDHKNNTILTVPHAEAEPYLKSGQFTLPKNARINIINQDTGEAASVEGKEAYNALQSGYRLETAQETHDRRLQEQYGGPLEQAKAGVEGLERGMTFGISDQYRTATGEATGEQLASRQEANPITSYSGEGAGMLATTPVMGPLAEATDAAVAKGLLKAAEKAGLTNPIARSIVGKIVPAATGSAVEGAFYGAGQLLSEDALGKADLNAENLAAYVGTGALLNGAFGAAFAGAAQIPETGFLKKMGKPVADYLDGFTSRDKAALDVLGYTPAKTAKLIEKNPTMAKGLADFLQHDVGLVNSDDAVSLASKVQAVKNESGAALKPILSEADAQMAQTGMKINGEEIFNELGDKLEDRFLGGLNSKSPDYRSLRSEVQDYLGEIKRSASEGGDLTLKDLHEFRQGADAKGYGSNGMPIDTKEGEMARFSRRFYNEKLKDIMGQTSNPELKAAFSEANRVYSTAAEVSPKIRLKAAKSGKLNPFYAAVIGGAAGQAFGDGDAHSIGLGALAGLAGRSFLMSDLRRHLVILGKIEAGRQLIDKAITGTVKAFGTSTRGIPIAAQMSVPSIAKSALAIDYSGEKPKKPKDDKSAYNNVLKNINSYAASPTAFMEKSNRQTASLYSAAPQTSAQLDNLAMTAMAYLSTKVPRSSHDATLLSAYQPVALPSTQALAKFARILEAVEKPAVVLKNLQNGTASREEMNVLKEVYPATFQKLQEKFMSELPHLQAEMPYNRRVQMGLLLGVPADLSMQPQNVLGLQALFGEAQAQQSGQSGPGGAVKSTASGMGELSKSDSTRTPLQEVQERSNDV